MTKKKSKPAKSSEGGGTPLTGSRLALAYELARHGIAQLLPDAAIVLSIVEQCKTTDRSASAALQKVARQGAKLSAAATQDLSDTLHFRYEHLYARAAQDGKLEAAARMLDRRARLAGLLTKEQRPKDVEPVPDEFEGRTQEELRYFREQGFWPDERQTDNVVPIDPLARIRAKAGSQ